jgi:hypothetical protein
MKSRSAFEFTVRKMVRNGERLYFWTFTLRDVHSVKVATGLWNEYLTILKRKVGFRGVRVLELHEEHGCHFHVLTNRRYKIRALLDLGTRYGFGRINVKQVTDVAGSIAYLCKYLSKRRAPCLKRARLWQAFGDIDRTRVKDILIDSEYSRILRRVMGKRSIEDELNGVERAPLKGIPYKGKRFGFETNFIRAGQKASLAYLLTLDPEFSERQAIWAKVRRARLCRLSHEWLGWNLGSHEGENQQ